MTIASAIQAKQQQVAAAYTACNNKGATMPSTQNLTNLATCISSISGGGGYSEIPSYQIDNGVLNRRIVVLNGTEFSSVTSIVDYGLSRIFSGNSNVSGTADFSKVTSIGNYGMAYAFYNTRISGTLDLSSLTTIGYNGLVKAFTGANITGVNLSSLTTVSSSALNSTFANNNITGALDLSSITSIGDTGMSECFAGNSGITSVDLSSLQSIYRNGLRGTFLGTQITSITFDSLVNIESSGMESFGGGMTSLQSLYFPAITSSTVQDYSFEMMLDRENNGVTVHFPFNMQSIMKNWGSVSSGFGGMNTVILFDLPATS